MALDDPETRRSVDEYRSHSRWALLGGSAGIVLATVVVNLAHGEPEGADVRAHDDVAVSPTAHR